MRTTVLLCSLLLFTFNIHATDFDLGGNGVLSIDAPKEWTVSGKRASTPAGAGYELVLKPIGDVNARCLMTFSYINQGKPDRARIRNQVFDACETLVAQSVEKSMHLKEFSLKQGYGAYCVFTDASLVGKKPKKEDYKVIGAGIVQLSVSLIGVVSMFADQIDGKEFKAMIESVNSLNLKPAKIEK